MLLELKLIPVGYARLAEPGKHESIDNRCDRRDHGRPPGTGWKIGVLPEPLKEKVAVAFRPLSRLLLDVLTECVFRLRLAHLRFETKDHCRVAAGSVLAFFFQAEDRIRDYKVTGVQTCALPISWRAAAEQLCREGAAVGQVAVH